MATLTTELKVARSRNGKLQGDMASYLDVSLGTYQKWESDPNSIPFGKLRDILEYLDDDTLRRQVFEEIGGSNE